MITYTTLMGLGVGLALPLVVVLGYRLLYRRVPVASFDGWALAFTGLGAVLTALGLHMSLAWPLVNPERFKNFMFGEPVVVLGILLLLAGVYLWRRGPNIAEDLAAGGPRAGRALDRVEDVLRPVTWVVFGLGLALGALTVAAFQYEVFASAPPQEPLFGDYPAAGNLVLCLLYALPALGCLLVPFANLGRRRWVAALGGGSLLLAGLGWLAVAVIVYYTHVALDFNFRP